MKAVNICPVYDIGKIMADDITPADGVDPESMNPMPNISLVSHLVVTIVQCASRGQGDPLYHLV
jgi:hypothetical protein